MDVVLPGRPIYAQEREVSQNGQKVKRGPDRDNRWRATDMESLRDQAAIVGIGETDYSRDSGRSELSMAVEAVKKAVADAGLETSDIDGILKFTADSTPQGELAACLGIPYLRYYGEMGPLGAPLVVWLSRPPWPYPVVWPTTSLSTVP